VLCGAMYTGKEVGGPVVVGHGGCFLWFVALLIFFFWLCEIPGYMLRVVRSCHGHVAIVRLAEIICRFCGVAAHVSSRIYLAFRHSVLILYLDFVWFGVMERRRSTALSSARAQYAAVPWFLPAMPCPCGASKLNHAVLFTRQKCGVRQTFL